MILAIPEYIMDRSRPAFDDRRNIDWIWVPLSWQPPKQHCPALKRKLNSTNQKRRTWYLNQTKKYRLFTVSSCFGGCHDNGTQIQSIFRRSSKAGRLRSMMYSGMAKIMLWLRYYRRFFVFQSETWPKSSSFILESSAGSCWREDLYFLWKFEAA